MEFERLTRRDLGRLAFASLTSASAQAAPKRIVSARLGKPIRYPQSHGDLWTATWADDNEVYTVSDDTQGFDGACSSNLALNRISGVLPPDVHGQTVNSMSQFGGWGEIRKEDGAMWKACGLASIDGALYMTVSRHLNPDYAPWIQQTWDASIIRSIGQGKTWTPAPKLDHAMFPGRMFSTPFFVMYGRDGSGMGDYVYAVSNDGAWNNGNWMTMGRVRRDRIARLNSADWEFVHNYEKTGAPSREPTARCTYSAIPAAPA